MTARMVRCPQCGKSVEYRTDNPARPFCSPRCKLIDLGAWAEERYAIGGTSAASDESEAEGAHELSRDSDPVARHPKDN
jgi:uncharacterized protein